MASSPFASMRLLFWFPRPSVTPLRTVPSLLLVAALLGSACDGTSAVSDDSEPLSAPAAADSTASVEVAPPPVPASRRLVGRFEYATELHGEPVRLGWSFDDEFASRWTHDVVTSTLRYRIVNETEDAVTIDLFEADVEEGSGPPPEPIVRHTFRLVEGGGLVHAAASDVVYARLDESAPGEDEDPGDGGGGPEADAP